MDVQICDMAHGREAEKEGGQGEEDSGAECLTELLIEACTHFSRSVKQGKIFILFHWYTFV